MTLPNLLIITWHDLGNWLGCYGQPDIQSPHADTLGQQGARFTGCYSTAPVCCPSRASMFTGLFPHATGVLGQINRGFDMDRRLRTLPQTLQDAGYATYVIGNNHASQDAEWLGFDYTEDASDEEKPRLAREIFETHRSARKSPFFVHIPTHHVHRPFGDEYDAAHAAHLTVPPFIPDAAGSRVDLASFHVYIRRSDLVLGQILAALDETGHADNTLVVFTTDHGAGFPRAKHTLYDQGLTIALLMRWPGVIPPNSRFDTLISNTDVFPTIMALIGREDLIPADIAGVRFDRLFDGGPHAERAEIIAEHTYSAMYYPQRAIRTRTHKYILNFAPGTPIIMAPGAIHRFGKRLIEEWYSAPMPAEELYDVASDPDEFSNLATDPRYGLIRRELQRRLITTLQRSGDPLLLGPIPDPAGTHTQAQHFDHLWSKHDGQFRIDLPRVWAEAPP